MLHVTSAKYLDRYRVRVNFNNGEEGIADFEDALVGPIFDPLRDVNYFRTFLIEGHTLSWSNGADFAPEYIRELITTSIATEQSDRDRGPVSRAPSHTT